MTPKVPISDTGTATLGIRVARRLRRNRKTTPITSRIEMQRVISTSRTEERMVRVESMTTCRAMVGGTDACSCGMMARTRSTVWMMLAPGWRKTISITAGLPLVRPPVRMSSSESVTSATSARRTAAPL